MSKQQEAADALYGRIAELSEEVQSALFNGRSMTPVNEVALQVQLARAYAYVAAGNVSDSVDEVEQSESQVKTAGVTRGLGG